MLFGSILISTLLLTGSGFLALSSHFPRYLHRICAILGIIPVLLLLASLVISHGRNELGIIFAQGCLVIGAVMALAGNVLIGRFE